MNLLSRILTVFCAAVVGFSGCTSTWMLVRRPDGSQEVSLREFAEADAIAKQAEAARAGTGSPADVKPAEVKPADDKRSEASNSEPNKSLAPSDLETLLRMIEQVKEQHNLDDGKLADDGGSPRHNSADESSNYEDDAAIARSLPPRNSAGRQPTTSAGPPRRSPPEYDGAITHNNDVSYAENEQRQRPSPSLQYPDPGDAPNRLPPVDDGDGDAANSLRGPAPRDGYPNVAAGSRQPAASTQSDHQRVTYNEVIDTSNESNAAPRDYQSLLDEMVRIVEKDLQTPDLNEDDRARREVVLRMLRLASERPADWSQACEAINGVSQSEAEFWKHLMFAMKMVLDARDVPDIQRRSTYALDEFQKALGDISSMSALVVRNLAFCTNVQSYGVYTKFDEYRFHPGQEVILYAEVENFAAGKRGDQFETALDGMCELYDEGKKRVGVHKFGVDRETCHNRRRDYYLPYRYFLPDDLYPGRYSLKLTITDVNSNKIDQASIDFTVDRR